MCIFLVFRKFYEITIEDIFSGWGQILSLRMSLSWSDNCRLKFIRVKNFKVFIQVKNSKVFIGVKNFKVGENMSAMASVL